MELPESQAALGVQEGALLPLGELQLEAFQVVHPGVSEVDLEFPIGQGDLKKKDHYNYVNTKDGPKKYAHFKPSLYVILLVDRVSNFHN